MSHWFTLDHLASVSITGRDAEAFAQSQFTADISLQDPGKWYPTAWCDSRGRVLSVMLAARREEIVELVAPATQVDLLISRLPMFAIGRTVEVATSHPVCGCLNGACPEKSLAFDPSRAIALNNSGASKDVTGIGHWRQRDLSARMPWLCPETSRQHLPQALGLESLGAISYSKGCFPGQEVIARVHYLGKVKYRVVAIVFDRPSAIAPGAAIADETGKRLGQFLWGLESGERSEGLGVISSAVSDGAEISVDLGDRRVRGRVSL